MLVVFSFKYSVSLVAIILFSLFLCYTIYYFVNEAIIYKQDLDKNISEVEKYQNISSYDITLNNIQFEDTVSARVSYNYKNDMFIVEKGAKVIINIRINKNLFDKKYGNIIFFCKFLNNLCYIIIVFWRIIKNIISFNSTFLLYFRIN